MATTTNFLREDQFQIHVGVDGISFPHTTSWASLQGGDVEAEDTYTRPGGMLPGKNLGGPVKRSDVTVTRQYTPALHSLVTKLESKAGHTTAWASFTPLDADKNPNGDTVTITGVLKTVSHPNWDANAANAAFLTLVIGADEHATAS